MAYSRAKKLILRSAALVAAAAVIFTLAAARHRRAEAVDAAAGGELLVALTFDDGPYPSVTGSILDTLEEHGVTATFFVLGSRIEGREEYLLRMEALGCEVGNHGWSHADFTAISVEKCAVEVERTDAELIRVLSHRAALIRPPYGRYNATVRAMFDRPLVLWTVDTDDWHSRDSAELASSLEGSAGRNAVILMHDQQRSTAEAVSRAIPALLEAGYRFVTVSELIAATDGACAAIKMPDG